MRRTINGSSVWALIVKPKAHVLHAPLDLYNATTLDLPYSFKLTLTSFIKMSTRVYALIVGIDQYKSGGIWNLQSCADDAKKIKRWLVNDLSVPEDQICLLLDSQATKQAIEDNFMRHLTNNPAVEPGDALLIYFAGHGSTIRAPRDWFQGKTEALNVQVLCPYDHDAKLPEGRVAGISDRSMHALISGLSKTKGSNITFIADCCFSPPYSPGDRRYVRWTPTVKATPDDLYRGLWMSARGQPHADGLGFFEARPATHVFLAACGSGGSALEGKDGGRFTTAFLEVVSELALHRTSYGDLIDSLLPKMTEGQMPVCLGKHKTRIIFDASPFLPDARYAPANFGNDTKLKVAIGALHGIVEGTEFSLHAHNYRGSRNPSFGSAVALEVHHTWCFARPKHQDQFIPKLCYAFITRWNSGRPFRVYLKATLTSMLRRWRLCRQIPAKIGGSSSNSGLNILRVKHPARADVSLEIGRREIVVERHDDVIAANCRRVVRIEKDALEVIDDAARFHLHLHRRNPDNPFQSLVSLELFRLDPLSWSRVGPNLLQHGTAKITYEQGDIFTVIVHNRSQIDIWPYLVYMDPHDYRVTMLYHPDPSATVSPLPKHSQLEIGSGKPGSEALSFSPSGHDSLHSGFLKLFISSAPALMGVVEQGHELVSLGSVNHISMGASGGEKETWDTRLSTVILVPTRDH